MERHGLIPNHQFSFRSKHITIEQIHRIVKRINNDMEAGRYCIALFFDVLQAFARSDIKEYFIKLETAFQMISMPS
jgi:hypothetical protein